MSQPTLPTPPTFPCRVRRLGRTQRAIAETLIEHVHGVTGLSGDSGVSDVPATLTLGATPTAKPSVALPAANVSDTSEAFTPEETSPSARPPSWVRVRDALLNPTVATANEETESRDSSEPTNPTDSSDAPSLPEASSGFTPVTRPGMSEASLKAYFRGLNQLTDPPAELVKEVEVTRSRYEAVAARHAALEASAEATRPTKGATRRKRTTLGHSDPHYEAALNAIVAEQEAQLVRFSKVAQAVSERLKTGKAQAQQLSCAAPLVFQALCRQEGIPVHFSGHPGTNGKAIWLGAIDLTHPLAPIYVYGHGCHERNHILYTDFTVFERLEAQSLLFRLTNLFEDLRVDERGLADYAGYRLWREALFEALEAAESAAWLREDLRPEETVEVWLLCVGEAKRLGFTRFLERVEVLKARVLAHLGSTRTEALERLVVSRRMASTQEALEAAHEAWGLLMGKTGELKAKAEVLVTTLGAWLTHYEANGMNAAKPLSPAASPSHDAARATGHPAGASSANREARLPAMSRALMEAVRHTISETYEAYLEAGRSHAEAVQLRTLREGHANVPPEALRRPAGPGNGYPLMPVAPGTDAEQLAFWVALQRGLLRDPRASALESWVRQMHANLSSWLGAMALAKDTPEATGTTPTTEAGARGNPEALSREVDGMLERLTHTGVLNDDLTLTMDDGELVRLAAAMNGVTPEAPSGKLGAASTSTDALSPYTNPAGDVFPVRVDPVAGGLLTRFKALVGNLKQLEDLGSDVYEPDWMERSEARLKAMLETNRIRHPSNPDAVPLNREGDPILTVDDAKTRRNRPWVKAFREAWRASFPLTRYFSECVEARIRVARRPAPSGQVVNNVALATYRLDERVFYEEMPIRAKNTAVLLLVDRSGSMNVDDVTLAKVLSARLLEALRNRAATRVGLALFPGPDRYPVGVVGPRALSATPLPFSQTLSILAPLEGDGDTPIIPALYWAAGKLGQITDEDVRKVVFVLTDGRFQANAERAVLTLKALGITVLMCGVGESSTPVGEYTTRVSSLREAPQAIGKLIARVFQ